MLFASFLLLHAALSSTTSISSEDRSSVRLLVLGQRCRALHASAHKEHCGPQACSRPVLMRLAAGFRHPARQLCNGPRPRACYSHLRSCRMSRRCLHGLVARDVLREWFDAVATAFPRRDWPRWYALDSTGYACQLCTVCRDSHCCVLIIMEALQYCVAASRASLPAVLRENPLWWRPLAPGKTDLLFRFTADNHQLCTGRG